MSQAAINRYGRLHPIYYATWLCTPHASFVITGPQDVSQQRIAASNSAWPVSQRCPPSSPPKTGLSCSQREPTQVIGAAGAESYTR